MSSGTPLTITPDLVEVLAELLPVGGDEAPVRVVAWLHGPRAFRRVRADYPNGARLTVHFNRQGQITSAKASLSSSIRLSGRQGRIIVDEAAAFGGTRDTIGDSDGDDGA